MEINRQVLQEKWAPVLDSQDSSAIKDAHKRQVTAVVLENQEKAFQEEMASTLLKQQPLTALAGKCSITGIQS